MSEELLLKCACGEKAEVSDWNSELIQCSDGKCRMAAWGVAAWNKNARHAHELRQRVKTLESAVVEAIGICRDYVRPWSNTDADNCIDAVQETLEAVVVVKDVIADVEEGK